MRIGFNNEMTNGFVAVKGMKNLSCVIPESSEFSVETFDEHTVYPSCMYQKGREYLYVICGKVEFMDAMTCESFEFVGGDFCFINPGTAYAQKIQAGTKLMVIKDSEVEEKEISTEPEVTKWLERDRIRSRDDLSYFYK